jgi:DNA primase
LLPHKEVLVAEYELSFEKLKAEVTIMQVVEDMLGMKMKPTKADELRSCCPISQGANPRHFVVTPSLNSFVCFCDECKKFPKRGGDAIELVRRMRRFDKPLPAAKEIAKHFGINSSEPVEQKAQEPVIKPKGTFDPVAYQKRLQPDHEALAECGVTAETIKAWGGGYATGSGSLAGRLVLPLTDIEGDIRGFVGVALKDEEPDLKYPTGVTPPFFFGVHMVQEGRDLHIVYHPLDALKYADDGYNVIAVLTPLTRDVLVSLLGLMDAKGITGWEPH